jgi:hypothetical protein
VKDGSAFKFVILIGLLGLVTLLPSANVEGEKFQSGVTIKTAAQSQCVDTNGDGVDDNTGGACGEAPAEPPSQCVDANGDGADDNTGEVCAKAPAQPPGKCVNGVDATGAACTPTEGTCGLHISSGVPINYGELTIGQESPEKGVVILNEGTSQTPAKVMIKGTDWVSDDLYQGTSIQIQGPEATHVSLDGLTYDNKKHLTSNGAELGDITGGQTKTVYFQLKLDHNPPAAVSSFHQDVTIDLLC